jgi:hypothetical protein
MLVKAELEKMNIAYKRIELGEAELEEPISDQQHDELKTVLFKSGLELMDDKKAMLVEKIKNIIVEMVHYADELPATNFSDYLSEKLIIIIRISPIFFQK